MTEIWEKLKKLFAREWARWLLGYPLVVLFGVGIVYYWRVVYKLTAFTPLVTTLIVTGLFSVLYLLVFLTAHFLRQFFPLKAAALIFIAGLLFVFINPPLQAPDETMHFLRAYSLGSGHFYYDQNEQYPDDVNLLVHEFPGFYNKYMPLTKDDQGNVTVSAADGFMRYYQGKLSGAKAVNATTPVQQTLPYLPQAAGIFLGRLLGGGALVCLYLGRIGNLLCYAALCGLALWSARRFRSILCALMLMPIGLYLAASTSGDGLLLGLSWLFVGLCLSERMDWRLFSALSVCFGVLITAKYTYFSLLPLLLLLPWDKENKDHKKWFWLLPGSLFLAGVFFFLLQTAHNAFFSNYGAIAYFTDSIRPAEQLRFILQKPSRYLAVFLYSVYINSANLFSGGVFGWMDTILPTVSYFSPLVLLLSAAFAAREGAFADKRTGIAMFLTGALTYGGVYTGMYLTSTPYQTIPITGIQTRYFLVAFFAGLVLAAMLIGKTMALQKLREEIPQKTPPEWRMLHIAFLFAAASALLLFQTYYIGA